MEAEMTLRPMTAAEQMYSYSQSQQISGDIGQSATIEIQHSEGIRQVTERVDGCN